MSYPVVLTEGAATDLESIYNYIPVHDSLAQATYVLDQIEGVFNTLSEFPDRGVFPNELISIGMREYRELFFKPYRIIYRVIDDAVYIYLIVDGRRDLQTLLQRRLLSI